MTTISYHPAAALTADRTARIASSSRAWLTSLLERIPPRGGVAVRALCHVLIAYWIADTMADKGRSSAAGFTAVAHHVARSLNALEDGTEMNQVKPTLKLLVEMVLAPEGLSIEPFREFLTQSKAILRRPDPALEADPLLMDKRILLYGAGILPGLPETSADSVQWLLDKFHLSAPAEVIDAMILQLECLTGWGLRLVDDGLLPSSLEEILAGLAVYRLRNHDLMGAARLMRLLTYLEAGRTSGTRDDLYNVLCMHHRTQGQFGWYGPEAAMLPGLNPTLTEDTEFCLPTTLECLWTLAERSVKGWRLFDKAPRYMLPAN